MPQIKKLYDKPKSLLRAKIQRLFLKFLLKLFPEKFLFYKNKIKFIMNKSGFYLYFYLAVIFLRLRYPLYYRLPSRQIYAFHITTKFLKILEQQKIDFFLLEGCLLGAVRQESFAGRPIDIDFGIKEYQLPKLLDAIPLLIRNGVKLIRKESCDELDDKFQKLQILFPCILVDIAVYRKINVGEKEMWVGEIYKDVPEKVNGVTFPIGDLENLITIKVYGKKFLSPANPEKYLEKVYGTNWKIPDKKQFFWKNKFN